MIDPLLQQSSNIPFRKCSLIFDRIEAFQKPRLKWKWMDDTELSTEVFLMWDFPTVNQRIIFNWPDPAHLRCTIGLLLSSRCILQYQHIYVTELRSTQLLVMLCLQINYYLHNLLDKRTWWTYLMLLKTYIQ